MADNRFSMSRSEYLAQKDKEKKKETAVSESKTTESKKTSSGHFSMSRTEFLNQKKYGGSINNWISEANRTITNIQNQYGSWRTKDSEKLNALTSTADDLKRAASIWRNQYADDPETVLKIDSLAKSLTEAKEYARNAYLHYGQYETKDKYNDAVEISKLYSVSDDELSKKLKNKDNPIAYTTSDGENVTWAAIREKRELDKLYGMSAAELQSAMDAADSDIAYTTSDGQNLTWKSLYSQKKREEDYAEYSSRDDWDKLSRYKTTLYADDTNFSDPNLTPVDLDYESVNNPDFDNGTYLAAQMTDEERQMFNYIYHTQGHDAAFEWQYALMNELEERRTQDISDKTKAYASQSGWHAAAAWAASRLTSPLAGVEYIGDLVNSAFTGRSMRNDVATRNAAVDSAITDKVNLNIGNWDAFDFGYSTVTSGVDSLLSSILGPQVGGAVLGLSAAAQATNSALDRGMSQGDAAKTGVLAGVAEALFERISIGNFRALKEVDPKSAKEFLQNTLKSMLVNASEEAATEIANITVDLLLNQDFSDYETAVRLGVQTGMSEDEAKADAKKQLALQVVESAASGALMGVGFSTIGGITAHTQESSVAKKLYGEDPSALVTEALDIDPENAYAQKMQERLDNGKTLTGGQMSYLAKQNEAALRDADTSKIKQAVIDRLLDLGATEDVDTVADALTKQAVGEKITKKEQKLIDLNKYAPQVAEELNPVNIRYQRSQYDTEWGKTHDTTWAEKIDTNRINVDEYSRLVEAAQIEPETTEAADETVSPAVEKAAQTSAQTAEIPDVSVPAAVQEKAQLSTENSTAGQETSTQSEEKSTGKENLQVDEGETVTLEAASEKYGAQAGAMISTYNIGGGKQDVAKFDTAYKMAYDMGKSGVSLDYAMNSETTAYLSEKQREFAYKAGVAAAEGTAQAKQDANAKKANGKTGWKKGTVRGDGVTIADLKKSFNDTQNTAYKLLSSYAEATGIDIVLYKSELDENGNFTGAQGKFKHSDNTIFIDVNAGLTKGKDVEELAKYTMMRTFAHEFTHFLEEQNPVQYNEFRKVVFDELTKRGENVHDLIEQKQAQDGSGKMTYDAASREVIAEAMTDILPDANFVEMLAEKHKTIFEKLVDKLKEFVAKLREYYDSLLPNRSREANALKEQVGDSVRYVESIVKLFDNVAVQAVENYQRTVATEEVAASETVTDEVTTSEAKAETPVEETSETVTKPVESVTEQPETVTEQPETVSKPAESVTETSPHGFTISDNVERGSLEIKFSEKPSEAVLDVLKSKKFRWHRAKKIWYGFGDRAEITDALNGAYEAVAEKPEQSGFEKSFWSATQAERDEVVEAIDQNTKISHIAPTEIRESADAVNNEEVHDNGKESENGSDNGAVHEPVRGSEGTSRLLEGVEPEAVRGSDEGRQPVQSGSDEGTEDAGRDRRADAAGAVSERSPRDRVAGDLQQLSSVTEEVTDTNVGDMTAEETEQLHEEVQQEVGKKSTKTPKGSNFVIGESLNLPNGTKARTRANIDAIKLVKKIAAEDRIATPAEQEILSKYVGWGGLADAFGKPVNNRTTRKIEYEAVSGLEAEFEELKSVLTEEEYKAARESTKNAHYTSIEVIKAMYDGLKQIGFTGGRMLEPSSGTGNFVGAMPAAMSSQVKSWTMVELDNITGMLAKYLYPNADVRIQGFEETNIPDGYMDVAIGNVPFGNYAIADKHYPKAVTSAIHNYFFAKALDKVRPGGVVMFITSSYTMNARDNAVRKYIMQRADLMGAIRLPNTAFAGNAGTSVVTDILVLKKRADRTEYSGEAFAESSWERISQTGWDGAYVNEYFAQHPEMVLGVPKLTRGMYSSNELTYDPFTDRGSLGDQIREAFKNIKGKMDYTAQSSAERENLRQAAAKKKSQKLQVKDGVIQAKDESGNTFEVDVDKDTAARITGMVAIRDAHTALCDALQQGAEKKTITSLRKKLNKAYDAFVDKYGYLNSNKNKKAINQFADCYAILSLENYSTEGKKVTASKSDIFSKDTIAANRTAASAENVEEGLTISLNTSGVVDVSMIARLTGQKVESVTRQLIDQRLVFKDKDGGLVPAVQYLSGNVRAKLREMEGLVGIDPDYRNNVEALREVVPPTVEYTDIHVNPGATWVPVSVYEDFVGHILNRRNFESYRTGKKDFSVEYVPETNEYKVSINDAYAKQSAQNTQVWGESGKAFSTIFENMLNGRRTNVYMDAGDGKRVLDKVKTEAVAEKVEKLNEEFRKWLWADESRRGEMQELYNQTYNALVTPKYSGANLTVNGLNSTYTLRDHQRDAVARIINSGGNTLLAHRVGAGKTMEMAAAAMKLKQLGVIKKPMFVVPNNVVAQWGNEFKDYFPAANILLVGDEDMTPAERMTTINKIKNNDYDAVILAYTKFEKIQMTKAWRQKFYEEQIDGIMFAINAEKEAQKGKGFTVKQLEAKRKQLENKLKKLTDKAKDEDGAMFEDLGVDSLFVDEAHNFKNLEYSTRMNNVSGLGKADGSQRAFDLYTKIRYLQQLNGGRGIVFATATPVMNSMTEMYIMQKYLQPDTLKQLGIDNFDSWAKMFGEVVNALEIAPSGSGYRLKQTFSKFKNVKALQQLFRSFTDVLTDVPGLKIPKMKGGKVQIVECEQGEFQKNYMAELAERAENVKNVDPSEDNMLKITSDGRKISYSQRMIDPSLPYEETGKIYKCCENVYNVYKESSKTKGTQMIFCDMATPKGKSSSNTSSDTDSDEFASVDVESAQLYDDIKERLVQLGIPAKEIAFIHDAKNDKQKAALSEKMNNGTIRVLLGSTGKMGVGLNAQVKAVAIHHLDAPWRPGDIEQRDGRVFRQKNENEEAYKFVYVTKGSFDSRLWDILERKQKFINQVMNGEDVGNEIEDTGEVTLSAAEVKAVASDNPLIMEQVALEKEISKLQSLQQTHRANVAKAEEKIGVDRRAITALETRIENVQTDIQNRKDTYSSDKVFSIQIGSQTYTDKKDAGTALVAAVQAKAKEGSYNPVGKFAGFTLRVVKTPEGIKGVVAGAGNYEFKTYPLNPTYGINHLAGVVEGMDDSLKLWNKRLSETKIDLETQKKLAAEPFEQAEKLKEKRSRYNEVMYILNPPVEQNVSEDTVQEQSRSYLGEDEYPTNGVHWAFDTFDFTEEDARFVWEAIANISKRKYNSYTKTIYGEYIAENGNKLFFINADYNNPYISRFIVLDDEYETNMADAKELIRNAKGHKTRHRDALQAVEDTYGYGYVTQYDRRDYASISWENRPGERKNRGADSEGFGEQHQQRTNTLTDREVLEIASGNINIAQLTAAERDALSIFQKRLSKLQQLEERRAKQGRLYKEQQFGTKVNREEAAKTLNRMHLLDDQIKAANDDIFDVEEKAVLRQVLKKARKVVEQQQREHDQETLKRYRDRRNNAAEIKKYRERLRGDVDELTNWILHPDNKNVVKHVPDALKDTVIPFLSSINFMSKQQLRGGNATAADKAFKEQLGRLAKVMGKTAGLDDMYANYTDLPPDFMDNMHTFQEVVQQIIDNSNGDFVINQMTSEELRDLSKLVRTLKMYIKQMNVFHVNAMFRHVYEAGDNSIDFLSEMKPAKNTGAISEFVLWQQMRPAYAFERFGKGGEAIYDGLRRGQATLAFNTQKIKEFSDKAYSAAEVKAWDKQVKTIRLGPDKSVTMRVSQIMSLYELSKREQAKGHILGEGIRVATFKDGREKISDVGQTLTPGELNLILRELTPRQIEVADTLQQFMEKQGGEWGNYVTLARFGEKQFGEKNYFPINSDGRHLQVDADEKPGGAALYALLNMGFTKQTQEKAQNRIVVYSIFDVFSNHMASMAQYNAFALPVIDALKWFNYQRKSDPDENGYRTVLGSVREQMDRAYGVPEETRPGSGKKGYAQNFVINIIKAFNGTEAQGTPYDGFGLQTLHHYNRAQVAYNFRVVVQQPLAITRAAMLVDYRSIIKGMKLSPAAIKRNIAEMRKYSGIAAWKSLGFYDVNISRGLTSLIKHDDTAMDKVIDFGMKGAETADTLTWAGIWSACKEEVIRKQKLTPKSEGFYEAVTKLFEDVIYKTQVVDSVLTKNEFMRDKGFLARSVSSFMSEPIATASMVVDAYDKYSMDRQRGMTMQQAWKKNGRMIGRVTYVYAVSAVLLAAVQAVADAWRDDDDYETFLEKWLEAFGGNLWDEFNILDNIPIVADIYEIVLNFAAPFINHFFDTDIYANNDQTAWGQIAGYMSDFSEILLELATEEKTNYTWYSAVYKALQAVSGITGLPMAATTREIVTAWNNTVGAMAPSLKVKTYDAGDKNEIKYAYQDGYLTNEEATEELLSKGLVDTEDEAYWIIQGWEAGEGYSKYDAVYDAVRNGGDFNAAMRELTSHGYTEKEVLGKVKGKIGEWYKGGEITKQQATNMLNKYMGMDSDEITSDVNKWSCVVETGMEYDDIKDEYLAGNITYQRAIEMRVRYGGQTQEEATSDVYEWRTEKEIGIPYSELDDAYEDGEITAAELVEAYITYGQKKDYIELQETYNTFAQPTGMSAEQFYSSYFVIDDLEGERDENGDIIGNGTQKVRWDYINSLDLTSEQKDALHLAFYKPSTLYKAPWH